MEHIIDEMVNNMNSNSDMDLEDSGVKGAKMVVFGCGGAGQNTMNWLYGKGIKGAKLIALNTDLQDLKLKKADEKILIGKDLTKGLGAGGVPEKGRDAAKESSNEIREKCKGSDLVFVCAGMGGGSGTGAAPVVAEIAKDCGATVISVVTMPFHSERARVDRAELGLKKLRKVSHTVVVIDNNRLVKLAGDMPIKESFAFADELISIMIKGIVEIISVPSLVNLDFADIKSILTAGGVSAFGIGSSNTKNRVEEAVESALTNSLLEVDYTNAKGALVHVTGGDDLTMSEVDEAVKLVTKSIHPDAPVIWGVRIDDSHKGRMTIMSIMTGVSSPQITGSEDENVLANKTETDEILEDLGVSNI